MRLVSPPPGPPQNALSGVIDLLSGKRDESELTKDEVRQAVKAYKELQRVLSISTRTADWTAKQSTLKQTTSFHNQYETMMKEFNDAEDSLLQVRNDKPAAVRPLGRESVAEVADFFILDNSLRETTVGTSRGHTLEEKHQIVDCIDESGIQEVILGSFGSKISVDSQIASRWQSLGNSFDNTWGFSNAYGFEGWDQEAVWDKVQAFYDKIKQGEDNVFEDDTEYYAPPLVVKEVYCEDDIALFKKAFSYFPEGAFDGQTPAEVLTKSESPLGRIPMGLLMMAGYGICNAIIEVDITYEQFDYKKHNVIERFKLLMKWCKEHLPQRQNVAEGEDTAARIFVNFTDFSNWKRSKEGGLEAALFLVHELCSLPEKKRPFGFMMEDPTSWLFPDEVGKLTRMVRLTMNRAGHTDGKFLVHIHMYFGLAEANVLSCLANGADGVWAAMCKVGAQVGHACSTVTAVNLVRAGQTQIAEQYDLQKMCKAAREIHTISTRRPCPEHEEVYGEQAFDVAFLMIAVPFCRYSLAALLDKLGIDRRAIRLNELSTVSEVKNAMIQHFGAHEKAGWDPKWCNAMGTAISTQLLTGLSRDYNSPLGLGNLYLLVSKQRLPPRMTAIMMENSDIPDNHPTVLEFIQRWNRLGARYEGEELPSPGSEAPSCMMYAVNVTTKPRRLKIPFTFWIKDIICDNRVMKPLPTLFKRHIVTAMTEQEQNYQGVEVPQVDFFEQIMQLKLFIEEAESLGVLPLVDDYSVRKNHDFFFGEDYLWLRKVHGSRPKIVNQLLRGHIDFFPKFYTKQGNHALLRCVRSAAKIVSESKALFDDLTWLREGSEKSALDAVVRDQPGFSFKKIAEPFLQRWSKIDKLTEYKDSTKDRDSVLDLMRGSERATFTRNHEISNEGLDSESFAESYSGFLESIDDFDDLSDAGSGSPHDDQRLPTQAPAHTGAGRWPSAVKRGLACRSLVDSAATNTRTGGADGTKESSS